MDAASRYLAAALVNFTALSEALVGLKSYWLNQFWPPDLILGEQGFNKTEFRDLLSSIDIVFKLVPARRHNKKVAECKPSIIRSTFLCLVDANEDADTRVLALSVLRISKDIYSSSTFSAFEMAKGYTKLVASNQGVGPVPNEMLSSPQELLA